MKSSCTIELHANGTWHDVASVGLFGEEAEGWRARSYSGYAVDWAVDHAGAVDAHAICADWSVGLKPVQLAHWPVFLIDMLPQGFGRQELLRKMGLTPLADERADWRVLMAGAGNPIGHLRVKEAAQYLHEQPGDLRGFTDAEVAQRGENFTEYLATYGLFVAGSSGVQGEWPKLLLTRAKDGLLYLDHSLPDEDAVAHFIVKFGRGNDAQLASILRHEGPYMDIAAELGLRVHAPLSLRERVLFIPRFDRQVGEAGLIRLAQESVATLTGVPGFDRVPSHDQVCAALLRHCSDPQLELLEYIKRDVANLAMGNKDNHARNTAVQRDFSGRIALTPLFDFAPMLLHPDGIARRTRWEGEQGGRPDWQQVIDRVCELAVAADQYADTLRPFLVRGLQAMASALEGVAARGVDMGMDKDLIAHLRPSIMNQISQLDALA